MIKVTKYILSNETNPYHNLALEELLLHSVKDGECILYLWQNRHTVVIGRNQNCWKECKVESLKASGGFPSRRLSGGGAVYHDLGNLNFTFIVKKEDYSVERQLSVIIKALESFGVEAKKTGRNDIEVQGKKFSGNAFFETDGKCYHHGTLMVNVDLDNLHNYLNVSADKLQSKGVSSVRSRVINLSEVNPEITIESLKKAMIAAFGEIYAGDKNAPVEITKDDIDTAELNKLTEKYSSDKWLYGRAIKFTSSFSHRFSWGGVDLLLQVNEGKILDAEIYSDSLETEWFEKAKELLCGSEYNSEKIRERLVLSGGGEHAEELATEIKNQLFN